MRKTCPENNHFTSRIIPGLTYEYRIVSLPYWAWFWLDDFMLNNKISYQGILEAFKCEHNIDKTFHDIAKLHQQHCMRGAHCLANDNANHINGTDKIKNGIPKRAYNLPKIYKLFGFMPCATTLEAVWTRKNYEENNKIN